MAARNQNQETETTPTEVEAQKEEVKAPAVLVSPDGQRRWTPENAVEAVNLRARGWSEETEDKSAAKTPAKS